MRYREFSNTNKNKKTTEVAPAIAAAAGTAAKVIPAAVGGIGRAVGGITGTKSNALSTSSNVARPTGTTQAQTGSPQQTTTQPPDQEQPQQVELKPGMNILQPALGKTPIKVKSVSGSNNEVELDTQKQLGHNIKVKTPELMAVLNQIGKKQ